MDADRMLRVAEKLIDEHEAYDEAIEILRWSLELSPGASRAERLLAASLVKVGKGEDARAILSRLDPGEDPQAMLTHALAQTACLDYMGAEATLTRALARDPSD